MAGGFHVDLDALTDAAAGINGTLEALAERSVEDVSISGRQVGHGGLTDALSDFCDRWQIGVENLAKDAGETASRLLVSVQNYLRADQAAQAPSDQLNTVLGGPAPADPG